jgi:hypothetical protein
MKFVRKGIVGIRTEEVLKGLGGWSGFTKDTVDYTQQAWSIHSCRTRPYETLKSGVKRSRWGKYSASDLSHTTKISTSSTADFTPLQGNTKITKDSPTSF